MRESESEEEMAVRSRGKASLSFECPAHGWCSVNYLGTKLSSPVIQPLNDKPESDADPQLHLRASGILQRGGPTGRDGGGAMGQALGRHPTPTASHNFLCTT